VTCAVSWGRCSLIGLLLFMCVVVVLVLLFITIPVDGVGVGRCVPVHLFFVVCYCFLFWIGCVSSNTAIMKLDHLFCVNRLSIYNICFLQLGCQPVAVVILHVNKT